MSLQVPTQRPAPPARSANGAGAFVAWALTGADLSAGLLTAPTIGPVLLVLGIIAVAVLSWRRRGRAATGVVSGLGLIPLAIAGLNRNGPGQVCTTNGTAGSCTTEWSPWPWLAAGIVLIAAGLVLFLARRRSAGAGSS